MMTHDSWDDLILCMCISRRGGHETHVSCVTPRSRSFQVDK